MLNTSDIIDYFLLKHDNDHRGAMAWLIGRMDGAERFEQKVKAICGERISTTIEKISEKVEVIE